MVASCDLQSHKACLFEATLIVALCKKAGGGEIKFFRAAFSAILLHKIAENAALKKYSRRLLHTPIH